MIAITNLALIYKTSFEECYKNGILIILCINSPPFILLSSMHGMFLHLFNHSPVKEHQYCFQFGFIKEQRPPEHLCIGFSVDNPYAQMLSPL